MSAGGIVETQDSAQQSHGQDQSRTETTQQYKSTARERQAWLEVLRRERRRYSLAGLQPLGLTEDPQALTQLLRTELRHHVHEASLEVEVLLDSDGRSRDFGFVTFADKESATRALELALPRADGMIGGELCIRGVRLLMAPAWGQGGNSGSRHQLQVRRRNSTYLFEQYVEALSEELRQDQRVGGVANAERCRHLNYELSAAVVRGSPPSFADEGARAHYTLERLPSRVSHVYDMLLGQHPAAKRLCEELFESGKEVVKVASVAGGPGFDAVALAFVAAYLGSQTRIECTVLDNELGWTNIVAALNQCLSSQLRNCTGSDQQLVSEVRMEVCDVTLSLSHPENSELQRIASVGVDLFVISYVVNEVEAMLREPGMPATAGLGGVFPGLFESCSRQSTSTAFLFLDSTPRLWPALAATAQPHGFTCHLPGMLRGHSKPQEPLLLMNLPEAAELDSVATKAEAERVTKRLACFERYVEASDRSRAQQSCCPPPTEEE